jgi:hypothetical protein
VIAKEGNEEFRRPVLKDKTQRSIAPAFKKILAQFAYPETAMRARLPESLGKITRYSILMLAFRQALTTKTLICTARALLSRLAA